ncbi:MAG TPA: hypothetical protein VN026_06195, partial [Bacteroidia bacterium]|nr:hypothetical protein [Bacteroidia bacterium]
MRKLVFIFFVFPFLVKAQGIAVGDTVSTGIIYKNIKDTTLPFSVYSTSFCNIDIDNDNVYDLRFSYTYNAGIFYSILKNVTAISNVEFGYSSNNNYADTLP